MDIVFKKQCIALRKQDRSVNEIMRITGKAKTSIYAHIQGMPLSAKRVAKYRKASGMRIRQFAIARTGKSARPFLTFDVWTPETVLLISHLLFDGELRRTVCAYNNRSKQLIERVETLMKLVYNFEPKQWLNKLTGVRRISYHNVALGAYLCEKADLLLEEIERFPLNLKRGFLRAFFDDEGCMDYRRNNRKVRGYQKDARILILISKLLSDFDISSRVVVPNEVVIVGKNNLFKFQKEINFSPEVRINGNRSNSIWKESLEKRELLDRAIKSFRA